MNIKKAILISLALAFIFFFVGVCPVLGQAVTLAISPNTISFAAADPDVTPVINANSQVHVTITVSNQSRSWQLSLRANGDFTLSGYVISISNVSWTGTPSPPFINGTLVNGVYQLAASGTGNSQGDLNFTFQNLWTHHAGSYSQTVRCQVALV